MVFQFLRQRTLPMVSLPQFPLQPIPVQPILWCRKSLPGAHLGHLLKSSPWLLMKLPWAAPNLPCASTKLLLLGFPVLCFHAAFPFPRQSSFLPSKPNTNVGSFGIPFQSPQQETISFSILWTPLRWFYLSYSIHCFLFDLIIYLHAVSPL